MTDVLLRAARNIGALILASAVLLQVARRIGGQR
jgi:hypothetical protein